MSSMKMVYNFYHVKNINQDLESFFFIWFDFRCLDRLNGVFGVKMSLIRFLKCFFLMFWDKNKLKNSIWSCKTHTLNSNHTNGKNSN